MKKRLAGLSLLLIATPVLAHDFWIQPNRFQAPVGASVSVSFLVGHGAARERWRSSNRIVVLADFFNGRRKDLRSALVEREQMDLVVQFAGEGLHVIGMQSTYAFSELASAQFNDYAKTEGLTSILAVRKHAQLTNRPGRER